MYTCGHIHFSDFRFGKIRGQHSETVLSTYSTWRLKYILFQLELEIQT